MRRGDKEEEGDRDDDDEDEYGDMDVDDDDDDDRDDDDDDDDDNDDDHNDANDDIIDWSAYLSNMNALHHRFLVRGRMHRGASGLILCLRAANARRRYFVTTSLIGWVQA